MRRLLSFVLIGILGAFLFPVSAKASILFYDPFDTFSGWNVSGTGSATANSIQFSNPSPDGGGYLRMNVGQFQQDRITRSVFLPSGYNNFRVSFYGWGSSVLDNTQQTSNTGIDFSEFGGAGNHINIGNSRTWNLYSLNLPDSLAGKNFGFGFRELNAGFGNDVLRIDGFTITGDAVVPEPGTLALLGSGLFGLIGFRRRSA